MTCWTRISNILLLLSALTGSVAAQSFEKFAELSGDYEDFGRQVALVGGRSLLVSPSVNTDKEGVVFVYDLNEDGNWRSADELRAADPQPDDGYGHSITVSPAGDWALVGANGYVDVYRWIENAGWMRFQRLISSDSSDLTFGVRLAMSDSVIAIGSPGAGTFGNGAVTVFRFIEELSDWQPLQVISGGESGTELGSALAFAGKNLIIGAPGAMERRGQVFVAALRDSSGYQIVDTLSGEVTSRFKVLSFGSSVTGADGTIVVGDPEGNDNYGQAFVYDLNPSGDKWELTSILKSPIAVNRVWFSYSMQMDEASLLIGTPFGSVSKDHPGKVYVFERESGAWALTDSLVGSNTRSIDRFGLAVGLSGDTAVIGSNSYFGAGSVFAFKKNNDQWNETQELYLEPSVVDIVGDKRVCDNGFADRYPCGDVDLISLVARQSLAGIRGERVNDLWGWRDPETGREYAIVARYFGISFVDTSDPLNPVVVGTLPVEAHISSSGSITVYRDHALVVSQPYEAGMQVFDLTRLRSVEAGFQQFRPDTVYRGFGYARKIVVNEESGFAYALGSDSELCGLGLHAIDVSEPKDPTFAGCFVDTSDSNDTGAAEDADCVIYSGPDSDHSGREICFIANSTTVAISDFTDKLNPSLLATVGRSGQHVFRVALSEDHRYLYQADREYDYPDDPDTLGTRIWDVSDLDNPVLASTLPNTFSAGENSLYVRSGKLYESNNTAGLRIFDLSDPIHPVEEAWFDTYPDDNGPGSKGSFSNFVFSDSGIILASSLESGLFVLARSGNSIDVDRRDENDNQRTRVAVTCSVFPNPAGEFATIRVSSFRIALVSIRISDVLGRTVRVLDDLRIDPGTTDVRIDLSGRSSGVYYVTVDGPGVFTNASFVKIK